MTSVPFQPKHGRYNAVELSDLGDAMKTFLAVVLLTVASGASAQVYKCTEGGRTVFADSPCADGAKPIAVKPASGRWQAPEPAAASTADAPVATPQGGKAELSQRERADLAAKRRGLDNEIDFKERHVISLRNEMNAELDALRAKKSYATNSLAGATWEQSISEEMNSVVSRYKLRIDGLQAEISQLRAERSKLQ